MRAVRDQAPSEDLEQADLAAPEVVDPVQAVLPARAAVPEDEPAAPLRADSQFRQAALPAADAKAKGSNA